jgi:hypothetical protein
MRDEQAFRGRGEMARGRPPSKRIALLGAPDRIGSATWTGARGTCAACVRLHEKPAREMAAAVRRVGSGDL